MESKTMVHHFPKPVRILSIEEALEQGSTPSELRTLSRCLERIAKRGYDNFGKNASNEYEGISIDLTRNGICHPAVNRKNAVLLRKLAKEMQG